MYICIMYNWSSTFTGYESMDLTENRKHLKIVSELNISGFFSLFSKQCSVIAIYIALCDTR